MCVSNQLRKRNAIGLPQLKLDAASILTGQIIHFRDGHGDLIILAQSMMFHGV